MQGPHQTAQKSSRTTFPCRSWGEIGGPIHPRLGHDGHRFLSHQRFVFQCRFHATLDARECSFGRVNKRVYGGVLVLLLDRSQRGFQALDAL